VVCVANIFYIIQQRHVKQQIGVYMG
jgi:hypothetical protein